MNVNTVTSLSDPDGNRNSASTVDTSIELVNSVVAIVKEVGEVLNSIPYVQSLSGVILQIVKVREEIVANKQRCREIIDKVLRMSKSIYEKLAEIARSNQREKLSRLEGHLNEHEITLTAVYHSLEKHRSRSRLSRFINRGLDELNEHDRRLDELNSQLILDIIFHITMEQAASAPGGNQYGPSDPLSSGPNHILPPKPNLMVERGDQFNAILNILLGAESSCISILGGGGFGKTTLARTILHHPQIVKRYASRYFMSCEGTDGVDALLLELGNMLGIKAAPSAILASVRRTLEPSTTLLCLDNFETAWEPFDTRTKIEELLEAVADIPNLSLLITLRGEQRPSKVAWSRPLLPPLSTLSLDGAKSILQEIASDHTVDNFTLQLLRAIDGIPLAVTLVSTLLRDGESSESLWRRWSKNHTQIIHTGSDDRQSNLNRSISLSVYSLRMNREADASRLLLAAISLLPNGFPSDADTLEKLQMHLNSVNILTVLQKIRTAVRRVTQVQAHQRIKDSSGRAPKNPNEINDIHTIVQTLRTVALIKVDETNPAPRIQMLSPVRLFCHHFLSIEIALVLRRLISYYIDLLFEAGDDLTNSEYYAQIVPEVNNIHSIFQRAYTDVNSKDLDIRKLVEATIQLTEWSWYTGYYARDTIQMALSKTAQDPSLRARCLVSIGDLYQKEAEPENAEKCFKEAVKLFKRGKDFIGEANTLQYLGNVHCIMRQFDQAEAAFKESLEICTKTDQREGEASGRFRLGQLYADKAQYTEAEASLLSGLQAYKQIPDLLGMANTTQNLSRLYIALGNLPTAEKFATESVTIAKKANYAVGEGNALRLLGHIYRVTDRVTDARQVLEQALMLQKQQNNAIGQLNIANELGQVYIQLDQLPAAEKLLTEITKVEVDTIQVSDILTTLGYCYICRDELDKAECQLDRALTLFEAFRDKSWQVDVLAHLGTVYFRSSRLEDAERVLKSLPDLDPDMSEDIKMRQLWVLGDLYTVKGQLEDAENSLTSAMVAAKWCQSSYQQGNILRSMGVLHVKRGHVDQAIVEFKQALEFHRKAGWVSEQATDLKRLGSAYKISGKSEEAEAVFKEAEELLDIIYESRALL